MSVVGEVRGSRLARPQDRPRFLRLFRRRAGADALSRSPNATDHILGLIRRDAWRMDVLAAVRALGLRDWAIGAGFVRAAVWDEMHGFARPSPLGDIDVLHCDPRRMDAGLDARLERRLARAMPGEPWSVTNQARMHRKNAERPYRTTSTAIAHWIEVPTAIAVRFNPDDTMSLIAPLGTEDLMAGIIRPTPAARGKMDVYRARLAAKGWRRRWPMLIERFT